MYKETLDKLKLSEEEISDLKEIIKKERNNNTKEMQNVNFYQLESDLKGLKEIEKENAERIRVLQKENHQLKSIVTEKETQLFEVQR